MRLSFKIALRFLLSGKGQTILIALGIAIGVSVQIFIGLLIQSLQAGLIDRTVGRSPHITIKNSDERLINNQNELVAKINNVEKISTSADGPAFLIKDDKNAPVLVRGFILEDGDNIYRYIDSIYEGYVPNKDNEIIIGRELSIKLNISILKSCYKLLHLIT